MKNEMKNEKGNEIENQMKNEKLQNQLKHYRLSQQEYENICVLLKRSPQGVEWALFSALWSEHCSYKSSRLHLKKFGKTLNQTVVTAEGENAGVVDLGQGERIVFKMESHNHPSYIEPYQGAATGVGGILRDIFTMGARPIALADYLCFGQRRAEKMPLLVDGVVRGIAGYGNCVGVPTITGQTNFDESYDKNILVNALALGLLREGEPLALSAAKGPGNWIVYVGAKTGKDGIHGASMASEAFSENSEAKKPNVQIGDPYYEKLLIESCLEVLKKGLVVSIQDMGAAGLTSSSFEMASKGGLGMKMNLDQVPLRDPTLTPEEILLSESQERMLLVCEPQKYEELKKVFQQWGLEAQVIGEVQKEKLMDLYWKGEKLTSIDPDLLVEKAPLHERPYKVWSSRIPTDIKCFSQEEPNIDLKDYLYSQLGTYLGASRHPIYQQYDQRVGLMTARGADHDVAFQVLPDSQRGIALSVGCRPWLMKLDARLGALDAVFYPALQMAAKGAWPVAMTDCLNYGNPEREEIMSEFVASVEALVEASLVLAAPVISGNVSFYNETLGENITSTPAIGLVGLRENIKNIPEDVFQASHSWVYRVRLPQVLSWASLNSYVFRGKEAKDASKGTSQGSGTSKGSGSDKGTGLLAAAGTLDSTLLAAFVKAIRTLSLHSGVLSSQVLSQGGLALTLAKMSLQKGIGLKFVKEKSQAELTQDVFYEVLFEVKASEHENFEKALIEMAYEWECLGQTMGGELFKLDLSELKFIYEMGLRGDFESLA